MTTRYDPWEDAARIAEALAKPDAQLLTVIGAESWCERCRVLRTQFDNIVQTWQTTSRVAIWFDLEDHAEFLGEYVPEDLPLLLHYRKGVLQQSGIVQKFEAESWEVCSSDLKDASFPKLWDRLAKKDWAK